MAFSWASAQAQLFVMPSGPGALYFGIEGGWTLLDDAKGRVGTVGFTQRFNDGFNVGARAGYEWGPLRFEEEFNFANNKADRFCALGACVPVNGQRNRYAIMTNAIYDFTFGWPITPHVGVGIGAVNLSDKISTKPPSAFTVASSNTWELGYQGIAGIRYNINPALAFDLDYRYLATTDPTFRAVGGVRYKSEYSTHNVVASLRGGWGSRRPAASRSSARKPISRNPPGPERPRHPLPPRSAPRFFFARDQPALVAAGSRRRCNASPNKLQATTVRKIISPG